MLLYVQLKKNTKSNYQLNDWIYPQYNICSINKKISKILTFKHIIIITNKQIMNLSYLLENILMPTSNALLQPISATNPSNNNAVVEGNLNNLLSNNQQIGSTWSNSGNINIDLDNLLSSKSKSGSSGPAPTINQLKNQSPTKPSQSIGGLMSPTQLYQQPVSGPTSQNNNFSSIFQ